LDVKKYVRSDFHKLSFEMLTLLVQSSITLWISSKRLNSRSLSLSSLKFLRKIQWETKREEIKDISSH